MERRGAEFSGADGGGAQRGNASERWRNVLWRGNAVANDCEGTHGCGTKATLEGAPATVHCMPSAPTRPLSVANDKNCGSLCVARIAARR